MNRDEIAQMMQDSAGNSWGTEAHFQRFASLVAAAKEAEFMDSMTIAYMDGYEKGKDAGAIAEREDFKKERRQYADWFDEAAADIADWGAYASEYFQSKHGLDRNVQDFKNRAAAIRARGASNE